MKNYLKLSILLSVASLSLLSCSDDDGTASSGDDGSSEISAITDTSILLDVRLGDETLFHFVEDAENSELTIEGAQETLGTDGGVMAFIKDDYVYFNSFTGEVFEKIGVDEEGVLNKVSSIPNLGTGGNPSTAFLDENIILHTSDQLYPADGVYSYQVIDIDNMVETDATNGTFALPIQADATLDYGDTYVTDYVSFEGNIYVPFVEEIGQAPWNAIYDDARVAVYDATTLELVKTISTTSTAALCNGLNPSYAIDESGDLYMSSSNTSSYANNESVSSGIVRINSGETDFDTDYFLDITALTGYHSLGMLYIGNGDAIVQVFNSDLAESGYSVEYYVVDLAEETASKLDIPAGSNFRQAFRRTLALLGNGNTAILVNQEVGSTVYIYDVETGTVSEGTTYTGADYIGGFRAF